MADTPNEEVKQQNPVWSGGTPVAQLSNDQLPNNPKRVVRTYASDLAALKGTAPAHAVNEPARPASAPAPIPQRAPAPAPMPIAAPNAPHHSNVSLSDAVSRIGIPQESAQESVPRLPPLQKAPMPMYVQKPESVPPPLPRPAPTPISEGVVHETQPSFWSRLFTALFGTKNRTDYLPPPVYERPAPPPQPFTEAPIASQIPSTAATEEAADREAVLARLRARVSNYPAPEAAVPPVFPTPAPAPLSAVTRPAWTPPTDNTPEPAAPDRLRTWSDDVANASGPGGASAFSILAAQADAPRQVSTTTIVETRTSHGLAYALGATVLVVGGSLVLYFSYTYFASQQPVQVLSNNPSGILTGDDSTTISGTGSALLSALAGVANGDLPAGDVRLVYLAVASSTPGGSVTLTESGGALLSALQLPAPSILLRNTNEQSTIGVMRAGSEGHAFFVLSVSSYQRAFAGMLTWEPTIGQDLATLYPSYPYIAPVQTGTSTPTAPPPAPAAPRFVDETVESHDVRALKDGQNNTILLYGFRDQSTLIIARDEAAFTQLLARLSASQ